MSMSKSKIALALLAAAAALSITACSSSAPKTSSTNQPAPAAEAKTGVTIKQGLPTLKKAIVELRRALSANDAAKTKAAATAVHDAWAKFEDEVKAKDKTLYGDIETQLGVIVSGAKADKFDAAPIKKAVGALDSLLFKVDADIAAADIKSGTADMVKEIAVLKDLIAKNDGAKAAAQADKVFNVWWVFEHDVKAKDAALYEKIEEPLKAIQAGTKQSPLDVKTLTDLTAKLEALVTPLTK